MPFLRKIGRCQFKQVKISDKILSSRPSESFQWDLLDICQPSLLQGKKGNIYIYMLCLKEIRYKWGSFILGRVGFRFTNSLCNNHCMRKYHILELKHLGDKWPTQQTGTCPGTNVRVSCFFCLLCKGAQIGNVWKCHEMSDWRHSRGSWKKRPLLAQHCHLHGSKALNRYSFIGLEIRIIEITSFISHPIQTDSLTRSCRERIPALLVALPWKSVFPGRFKLIYQEGNQSETHWEILKTGRTTKPPAPVWALKLVLKEFLPIWLVMTCSSRT